MQRPLARQQSSSEQQRSKVGFPIRKFPDQSLFAAPRNLSQRTTSFIASQRQGIHQIPLRHLIALIAKARFRRRTTEDRRQGKPCRPRRSSAIRSLRRSKRPVLLQTHPGSLAVSQRVHDWCCRITEDRDQRADGPEPPVVCRLSSVIRYRMRFLFTMSDIERFPPQGPKPFDNAP